MPRLHDVDVLRDQTVFVVVVGADQPIYFVVLIRGQAQFLRESLDAGGLPVEGIESREKPAEQCGEIDEKFLLVLAITRGTGQIAEAEIPDGRGVVDAITDIRGLGNVLRLRQAAIQRFTRQESESTTLEASLSMSWMNAVSCSEKASLGLKSIDTRPPDTVEPLMSSATSESAVPIESMNPPRLR